MTSHHNQPDPHDLLLAEFNYIAQTAFQTNEDRARYVSFYVLSVGSMIAAIFSSQLTSPGLPAIQLGFAVLFFAVGGMGLLTVWQLVQLRLAWFESIRTMNQIKQYYIDHDHSDPGIGTAIAWTNEHLPARLKFQSISFLTAVQVSILAGINLGSAFIWIGLASGEMWWITAFLVGVGYMAVLLVGYWYLLREDKPKRERQDNRVLASEADQNDDPPPDPG